MTKKSKETADSGVTPPDMVDLRELIRREVLRDLLGSGGLAAGRMSQEVLFLLPRAFVEAYIETFWRGLKEPAKGTAVSQQGVSTGMKAGVRGTGGKGRKHRKRNEDADSMDPESGGFGSLQAQGGGKTYKEYWTVVDERMLKIKEGVDKELIRLATEMKLGLEAKKGDDKRGKGVGRQCLGCRRFLRATDRFCSGCGEKV